MNHNPEAPQSDVFNALGEDGRAKRALGIGLCDPGVVLSPERQIRLEQDLADLHQQAHPGILGVKIEEVIV